MTGILILFHCESNPGFAAASHELTFLRMAINIVGSYDRVHFAYRTLEGGKSPTLPDDLTNIIEFDPTRTDDDYWISIAKYVRQHKIKIVFGFDQPPRHKSFPYLRKAGVSCFVSYWGAPMSSPNRGLKLLLKKLDVLAATHRPDHFIFQSEGMQKTATHGRGIPVNQTSVVRSGINMEKFAPPQTPDERAYAFRELGIDPARKLVFFSGHMEPRKGVDVIVKAAAYLVNECHREDIHFLLVGNKPGQEEYFYPLFKGTRAEQFITFAGYRKDVPSLLKSCSVGFIASTGWDSFPMSSIEMAATELPLIVSDLPGLREAVTSDTGILYPVGDHHAASAALEQLIDNPELAASMGQAGRRRALAEFSVDSQLQGIEAVVRDVMQRKGVIV